MGGTGLKRGLLVLLLLVPLTVWAAASIVQHGTKDITYTIVPEATQIVRFDNWVLKNSIAFIDSLDCGAGLVEVSWTSPATGTTRKMIADSMVAYINATEALSDTLTAAVANTSGDTGYTITGLPGRAFVFKAGDTAQDTATLQVIDTTIPRQTDTIQLFSMYQRGWRGLWGKIVVGAAARTARGFGTLDTSIVTLNAVGFDGTRYALKVDTGTIPNTVNIAFVGNDTLFKEHLELILIECDSANDTAGSTVYPVKWEFIPTE